MDRDVHVPKHKHIYVSLVRLEKNVEEYILDCS